MEPHHSMEVALLFKASPGSRSKTNTSVPLPPLGMAPKEIGEGSLACLPEKGSALPPQLCHCFPATRDPSIEDARTLTCNFLYAEA